MVELEQLLMTWISWFRARRAITWAMRGMLGGLFFALMAGLVGLLQARLLRDEFLALVFFSISLFTSLCGLIGFFLPLGRLQAARFFDLKFALQERVSTALEWGGQGDEMSVRLVEDATRAARKVDPVRQLPMRLAKWTFLLMMVLAVLLGVLWVRGDAWFQAAQQARNIQQAVDAQEETLEALIQKIETNPALTEEQKRLLTAPLEEALNNLQNNPSLENSVSTLTSTSEKLQTFSSQQALQTAQNLQQAGSQLAGQEGSPLQTVGKALEQGNLISAANQLANMDLSQLNQQEQLEMAQQLEALAQSVQAINPQLAAQLQQAAQALRNGDIAAAQQALSQAAQSLAQTGQQAAMSQAAGQASQQLQQGAGQLIAAGGGQESGTAGQNADGQTAGQGGSESGGSGSGSGQSQGGSLEPGREAGSDPIPQNNGVGDGGLKPYEQIYAPSLLGGEDGQTVTLPDTPGEEGEVIGQGPTTPGESGQSLVPYTDVFSQYEKVNRQAIESGDIPFEFTTIIRSYFDSLRP